MPTGRSAHIDVPLSNVMIAAFETQGDFVANAIFPAVPVDKQSNKYYTLKKEAWLARPNTYRAPRAQANRIEFDISSDSYFADNYALAHEIPLEDLKNADSAIRLRESAVQFVTRGLLADLEIRAQAQAITNVSTVQRLATAGTTWDAVTSADIQGQIADAHLSIFNNTGLRANTLVLDYQSYIYAKRNTALLNRFQYQQQRNPGLVDDEQLKAAFMVDNLYVARSQKNNANPGQTGSITSIWGPTALLTRVEGNAPSLMTATYGIGMRWTNPEFPGPFVVTTHQEDWAGSRHIEVIEAGYWQDEKVVASALGFYINTKSGTPW